MQLKKIWFILLLGWSINGCTTKEYVKQNSAFIVFKTPTIKYADLGFIYENEDEIKVEIYGSGQALMTLKISENLVCMSLLECMDKKTFNSEVLSEVYPLNMLDNIFKGKKIYEGKNLTKTRNGFTQNISNSNKYKILYSVLNKEIIFRDTINDILIKVTRMDS